MNYEQEYRERKVVEAESALRVKYGELERESQQFYRLDDGRHLNLFVASGSNWYAIPQRIIDERRDSNDLVALAWTDEEAQRYWIFSIPIQDLRNRITESDHKPTLSNSRYSIHIELSPDGHRLRQLDMPIAQYEVASRETDVIRSRMGIAEPSEEFAASASLPPDKLKRLLRWRLEGIYEQGDDFDFVLVRRRLKVIQPTLRVLEENPDEFTAAAWQTILDNLHAAGRQKSNILKNNSIEEVRSALRALLFDESTALSVRLERFAQLKNVGPAISGELVGWFDPDRYPMHNGCDEAGLRYFGFRFGPEYDDFKTAFDKFRNIYEDVIGHLQPDLPINLEIDQLFNQIHKVDLKAKDDDGGDESAERYWRITLPAQGEWPDVWEKCVKHGFAAIGFTSEEADRQVRLFAGIKEGDWVAAFLRDRRIGGIGKVTEAYRLEDGEDLPPGEEYWGAEFRRRIGVDWYQRELDVNRLSQETRNKFLRGTVQALSPAEFAEVKEYYADLLEPDEPNDESHDGVEYTAEDFLQRAFQADSSWHDEVVELLKERGQIILYGPPGTGKTFIARELAKSITGLSRPGESRYQLIQFHPSYAYEDFIEGIRPESSEVDGQHVISYPVRSGTFRNFCTNAAGEPGPCVFVIDEINRGNIASVFGELMYALEYRDTEAPVRLPYSGKSFQIPRNVYIIGTMNTADRSISLMDFALRRRFHFIRCPADVAILERWIDQTQPSVPYLLDLFKLLKGVIEDEDYQIGVSYFMDDALTEERLKRVWRRSIEPYLETYFIDRRDQVEEYRWNSARVRSLRTRHEGSPDG
ncbi:MAG: McrB family protein [Anaerolineae bacterium]